MVDITIAFTNFTLRATELGYGTCWIGAFNNKGVKKVLRIPDEWNVVSLTPLGYPQAGDASFVEPSYRKPMEEIVSTDKF